MNAACFLTGLCLLVSSIAGCAGRAEFRRGLERDMSGDLRGAYREYHDAYRRSGSRRHQAARDRAGSRISGGLRESARLRETAGDLEGAMEGYLLALEYDPGRGSLVGDYVRVRDRISTIAHHSRRAAAAEGTWEAYRTWRDLRDEGVDLPEVEVRIGSAAAAAADREIAALGAGLGTGPGEGLPAGGPDLELLLASFRDLQDRLEEAVRDEALDLATRQDLVLDGIRSLQTSIQAEQALAAARKHEKAGDLPKAVSSFERALLLNPDRAEIREGFARAVESLVREASEAAAGAMARGAWSVALLHLERLERLVPESGDVERRANRCRREVRDGILREGSRFLERGLPGNALCAFLRARLLGLATPEIEREIALLEETTRGRHRSEVHLAFRAAPEEDEGLDASLWGEDVRATLEEASRAAFRSPTGKGPLILVEVEDVDFEYLLERQKAGSVESRFVAEFTESENPEHLLAQEELALARKLAEEARAALSAAPVERRSEAAALLAIAEGRERRAVANAARTHPTIPRPVWKSEVHPVVLVRLRAALALRTRIGGEARWLEVREVAEDREVEGDSQRGIPPDPPEIPSRSEALRLLAPRLLEGLAAAVRGREVALRTRLLDEARERLFSEAYESAVENLVIFIYAEKEAGPGPRFAEAVDLLKKLTGYDLPGTWRGPSPKKPLQS